MSGYQTTLTGDPMGRGADSRQPGGGRFEVEVGGGAAFTTKGALVVVMKRSTDVA